MTKDEFNGLKRGQKVTNGKTTGLVYAAHDDGKIHFTVESPLRRKGQRARLDYRRVRVVADSVVNYNAKTGDVIEFDQQPPTRGPRISCTVADTRPGSVTVSPSGKYDHQACVMSYEDLISRNARFTHAI